MVRPTRSLVVTEMRYRPRLQGRKMLGPGHPMGTASTHLPIAAGSAMSGRLTLSPGLKRQPSDTASPEAMRKTVADKINRVTFLEHLAPPAGGDDIAFQ